MNEWLWNGLSNRICSLLLTVGQKWMSFMCKCKRAASCYWCVAYTEKKIFGLVNLTLFFAFIIVAWILLPIAQKMATKFYIQTKFISIFLPDTKLSINIHSELMFGWMDWILFFSKQFYFSFLCVNAVKDQKKVFNMIAKRYKKREKKNDCN